MAENNQENKKSSKDLWLVLIFVDIIALCVFSYFIYASFANSGKKSVQIKRDVKTEEIFLEEVDLSKPEKSEQKEIVKETPKEKKAEVSEPMQEAQVKEEPKPIIKEEPKEEEKAPIAQKENKESFTIVNSGKWRKVTFRYFDDAKSVSIVSGFTMAKPSPLKKVKGVWETTLTIAPGTYRYMFIVNGKEVKDPYNQKEEKGRSLIVIK